MKEKVFKIITSSYFDLARAILFILSGIFIFTYIIICKEHGRVDIVPLLFYLGSIFIFFPDLIIDFIKEEKKHF